MLIVQLFQIKNTVQGESKLLQFLAGVLPEKLPVPRDTNSPFAHITTRDEFINEVKEAIRIAPMAIRITPHILSVTDWENPFEDPIRRQFIPLKASLLPDHPRLTLDSLGEEHDSPVKGLVHRYPDKALFLGKSLSALTNLDGPNSSLLPRSLHISQPETTSSPSFAWVQPGSPQFVYFSAC